MGENASSKQTAVVDKPFSGQSPSAITKENENRVNNMIYADRCITAGNITEEFGWDHSDVEQTIYNLGCKKNVYLVEAFEAHEDIFFVNVYAYHVSWAYLYDPETNSVHE